jgi:hypothetical protein
LGEKKNEILHFPKKTVAKVLSNASNIDINASSAPGEPAMDQEELRIAVQRIITHGTYEESYHSSKDRAYRNISDDDIQVCLMGQFRLAAVEVGQDRRGRACWKYEISGRDIEGEALSLVIAVNKETQKITVVTKF